VINDLERIAPLLSKILHVPLNGKWPRDLSVLGISEDEKKKLEKAYSAITNAGECNLKIQKKHKGSYLVVFTYPNGSVKEVKIPFKFAFASNKSGLTGIILKTKKIVGEGGERQVKLCFEMLKGEYLARKPVAPLEHILMESFQNSPTRGIPHIYSLAEKSVTETLYAGSLSILFGTVFFDNLMQRVSLLGDLLSGLASLHGLTLKRDNQRDVKVFHFDIKPANILVRQNPKNKMWEAVLSDFGFSGNPTVSGGSIGYKAPEEVKLELQLDPLDTGIKDRDPVVENNLKYGQAMDIWSMGLVATILLTGRVSERINPAVFPPIPCFEDCFFNTSKPRKDHKFADLTQSQMDKDVMQLRPLFPSPKLTGLWAIVGNMLQVDPEKRVSAREALTLYHEAIR